MYRKSKKQWGNNEYINSARSIIDIRLPYYDRDESEKPEYIYNAEKTKTVNNKSK